MRIAFLGHRSSRGATDGIITYSREITEGLRRRGVEVIFFHHAAGAGGSEGDEQSVALPALTRSHRFVLPQPGARRRLSALLERHGVDLVHVSLSFSMLDFNLPGLCHRLGIPLVATFHAPFDTRLNYWGSLSQVLYRVYSQPLARCDAVIIFGETQRRLLARMGVPEPAIRVIPNGVDVDRYSPGESDRRGRLGARQLFTYLGRIDPEKNVETLLQAFSDSAAPADVHLLVVGSGSDRRRLERRFRGKRVHFTGAVTDESEKLAILRATDAFFLPSSIEGLSLSLLEAMACGAAVVATDVGSDGDAIRSAGIVLEPAELEAELGAAIRMLTEMPWLCAELGRRARARAVERFSLDANLDRLLELYGELVAAKAPS